MGAITFLSRNDHRVLDSYHQIFETGSDEDLAAYHTGDSVEIYYSVPEDFLKKFPAQQSQGLRCYEKPDPDKQEGERYSVILGFTITRVLHSLSRERKNELLLSEVMHEIFVEPESDLAEEALMWLLDYLRPDWMRQIDAGKNTAEDSKSPGVEEPR
jgi:hypothetical protein